MDVFDATYFPEPYFGNVYLMLTPIILIAIYLLRNKRTKIALLLMNVWLFYGLLVGYLFPYLGFIEPEGVFHQYIIKSSDFGLILLTFILTTTMVVEILKPESYFKEFHKKFIPLCVLMIIIGFLNGIFYPFAKSPFYGPCEIPALGLMLGLLYIFRPSFRILLSGFFFSLGVVIVTSITFILATPGFYSITGESKPIDLLQFFTGQVPNYLYMDYIVCIGLFVFGLYFLYMYYKEGTFFKKLWIYWKEVIIPAGLLAAFFFSLLFVFNLKVVLGGLVILVITSVVAWQLDIKT